MDDRLVRLKQWLADDLGMPDCVLTAASSDASFRRYFRATLPGQSFIVMDAPPEKEDCQPFIAISALMSDFGLNVPQVLEQNRALGFLLLTDLGDQQYLTILDEASADRLYGDAISALVRLQIKGPIAGAALPIYDRSRLIAEMELFRDWFLLQQLELELSAAEHDDVTAAFDWLAEQALAQPQVWVHRDYHSRNLMRTTENNPGILDFQDAVIGPISYDLVSLLKDCYIAWPRVRVEAWVAEYAQQARRAGLELGVDDRGLLEWFDLMGLQRHLKVAGIFSRLNLRDGKPGYLKDIPLTLDYIMKAVQPQPQLAALHALILKRVLPAMSSLSI